MDGKDSPLTVDITAKVMEGILALLDIKSGITLERVHFGPTLYGTDTTQSAILYNNSPETVCFVAVMNEEVGGVDMVGKQLFFTSVKNYDNVMSILSRVHLLFPAHLCNCKEKFDVVFHFFKF